MSNRHEKIGIKQGLRIEWLDKALNLKLAGLKNQEIKDSLKEYMANRLDNGKIGQRGKTTTEIAVSMLFKTWINPDKELKRLQKKALSIAKNNNYLPCHWAMLCAEYPFWYRVAIQTGRLLNLQKQVSKKQIIQRIREIYGDRSSVIRSAQRVIQGFLGVGVLEESKIKNFYSTKTLIKSDYDITILLFEAVLHAEPDNKLVLGSLTNNPAFFPFQLPVLKGDYISQQSDCIEVIHYGLDDELLRLKK